MAILTSGLLAAAVRDWRREARVEWYEMPDLPRLAAHALYILWKLFGKGMLSSIILFQHHSSGANDGSSSFFLPPLRRLLNKY